jgi:hypothetical protein
MRSQRAQFWAHIALSAATAIAGVDDVKLQPLAAVSDGKGDGTKIEQFWCKGKKIALSAGSDARRICPGLQGQRLTLSVVLSSEFVGEIVFGCVVRLSRLGCLSLR